MKKADMTPVDFDNLLVDVAPNYKKSAIYKFFAFSLFGIFMFFISITLNGKKTIPLDHLVTFIRTQFSSVIVYYILVIVVAGAVYPFYKKTWNRSVVEMVISTLKIMGAIASILVVFKIGPSWLLAADMGPYWYNSLLTPIGVLVPIGAIFLAMLVGYGLLEFIGILVQPIMRPIWKTPGRSAIDAVASFVGSYSIGLLITNRIYKEGKYTTKEAVIIATGFSTVSVTFMIVVAKTLGLMDIWNLYFWVTFLVTFLVTAISVRIWPIRNMSTDYYNQMDGDVEKIVKEKRLQCAWREALQTAENAPNLWQSMKDNVKDGLVMAMGILPTIMSIGLIGLWLVNNTPIFDYAAYLFVPITYLLQIAEPLIVAKAAVINLIDMFLPSLVAVDSAIETRFIVGTLSISAILFFSALIPCILSTEIPISLGKMIAVWFVRTVLTLMIVTPIAYLLL
ncbi:MULTISPECIES: YjiH family protein [unclassified Lysinibacillus]|uniref:YjiH family protein n=1 Tax=unclassified Lysinibacillus TaxID=2636778 RepID=UPI00382CBF7E